MSVHCLLIVVTFSLALVGSAQTPSAISKLPVTSREKIIATAKEFADYTWTSKPENLKAPCVAEYESDWKPGQRVIGVPYDWGGIDSVEEFGKKLARGFAAGSHSRHGVSSCTAGTDCSGFVAYCWGLRTHKYSTRTIREIAGKPRYNWFTDMKPGDALNKPGSHIVLFAGYNPNGTINIYEASGSAGRVVYRQTSWSRLKGYLPLQYKMLADEQ